MEEITPAEWGTLIDKISERKTVLVIGDNLTKVNDISLVEYISKSLFEQVKRSFFTYREKMGVPEEFIQKSFDEEMKLPTNGSIMDMSWWKYSDAFSSAEAGGDLVQFVKKTIDDIPEESLDYGLLEDILSINKFNIILSTSYSKAYKDIVEQWAIGSGKEFFYADIQNEGLVISPAKKDTNWYDKDNQVLFINLVGHINSTKRSLDHILVTEEDMILFVLSWISALKKGKPLLVNQLKDSFLLVLGCHAPSWAFRFIWYVIKNPTLEKMTRSNMQSICSRPTPWDENVKNFILHYSTKIIDATNTDSFVEELKKRWFEGGYDKIILNKDFPSKNVDVFVSYASEDQLIVEERLIPILQSLNDEFKVSFWYDKQNLRPGNAWEKEIEYAIGHTSVFLSLQTSNSKETCYNNKVKYLKHEWMCAIDRNARVNKDHNDALKGGFNIILPILYESKEQCLYPLFSEFQYLSIEDPAFVEKLKESILRMKEMNQHYIE